MSSTPLSPVPSSLLNCYDLHVVKSVEAMGASNPSSQKFLVHKDRLLKPYTELEAAFYDPSSGVCPEEFREIIPFCKGVVNVDGAKYISMTNLTHGMTQPHLFDVKLGTRTYDPLADEEKIRHEIAKYVPQAEIGFRIVGMHVWETYPDETEPRVFKTPKHWGRHLRTLDDVEEEFVRRFVPNMTATQKETLIVEMAKIIDILERVGSQKLLLYATSLYVAFDPEQDLMQVKLIDFGHAFLRADHPDHEDGVLHGIRHLFLLFKKVLGV